MVNYYLRDSDYNEKLYKELKEQSQHFFMT
jgi:hypothetical protein